MEALYLKSVTKQLNYYKQIAEQTFVQLKDEQLFQKLNEESNSIANIVRHLWGNMLSRWTDFLTTDGEKDWRDRDTEFEDNINTRAELLAKWDEGWACLFKALESINETNLDTQILIRKEPHAVLDAINRQLAHYPYHIGQIIFIGKMLCNQNWKTLSIAKGKSKEFNASKMQ